VNPPTADGLTWFNGHGSRTRFGRPNREPRRDRPPTAEDRWNGEPSPVQVHVAGSPNTPRVPADGVDAQPNADNRRGLTPLTLFSDFQTLRKRFRSIEDDRDGPKRRRQAVRTMGPQEPRG